MSSFKPDLNAHLRDWQNIKLPLVALHVTFKSLISPKDDDDDDDPDVLEIERAGLCVFLTNWEGRFPVHTVKTLLFLLLLSAISYSSSCSKIIKFSHCNFLRVDLMVV